MRDFQSLAATRRGTQDRSTSPWSRDASREQSRVTGAESRHAGEPGGVRCGGWSRMIATSGLERVGRVSNVGSDLRRRDL